MTKVSFIIPAYQVEKYIVDCIKSILNQTKDNFEIIIVDDGSVDNTLEIIREYADRDSRITVIHQENQGVASARNVGIDIAKGEWICFVDGDDFISPFLIEEYLPYLVLENDVCFISYLDVDENRKEISRNCEREKKVISFWDQSDFREFQLATFNRDFKGKYDYHKIKLAMPGKFYRRKFILENNIRFPLGVSTGEDAVFNLYVYRMANRGVGLDVPLYYHRVWKHSVSHKYNSNAEYDFSKLHNELDKFINSDNNPQYFQKALDERKIWSLGFCCILNYCHINNPKPYQKRRQEFLAAYDKYESVIKQVELQNFRIKKQILFWLMKRKQFALINLLCKLLDKN